MLKYVPNQFDLYNTYKFKQYFKKLLNVRVILQNYP